MKPKLFSIPVAVLAVAVMLPAGLQAQTLELIEAHVARSIEDRMPVDTGTTFPEDVGRVWAWTRVKVVGGGESSVTHVWLRGGEEVFRIDLPVRGESWRTWSNKGIPPEWAGDWKVEFRDPDGNVIGSIAFTVGE